RSQAKRLTMRFERFRHVILDFNGVSEIGQAFADEVFRVFQASHPGIIMAPTHMTKAVTDMVNRARKRE
ncbi:MAG: STAS-like domain-containing protein, partial [Nitrospira sp.]|nr:STAS-like domain-containing protein [Nitrospira sp.]